MGTLNILKDSKQTIKKLDILAKEKEIVGIKIFPGNDKHYPNDSRLEAIFRMCAENEIPLVIHTGWNSGDSNAAKYNDPKYIIDIVERYRGLKVVISHYFWPEVEYCYRITKDFDNIYFDTSALEDYEVGEVTGRDNIINILERTISDNSKRVLFGSDYGICSIEDHIELINQLDISFEDRERVFYKNAIEVFNLGL